jgi:hypothetical protein
LEKCFGLTHSAPLCLLFELTEKELAEQYLAFVETHDEVAIADQPANASERLSIIFDGLVFSTFIGQFEIGAGNFKKIFNNLDLSKTYATISIDLGDNLKGGETIPPIIKGLLAIARCIGKGLGAAAICWHPARIISDFTYFSDAVVGYENHGFFPVLPLIDFVTSDNATIISKGLAFLSTQELHYCCEGIAAAEAMRNVLDIVHEIALNGPVIESKILHGFNRDETIDLKVSHTGQQVFARVTSKFE